ncbi:MAG: YjbQ family protein [Candidatus Korarchaeota archaeon]|nr:YjbQ family protein [Candidatus Korarchaeota archaeon]NIU85486.1 YjbQ family protein [Candidatus Thorarchaeota archaeon]NIW15603.1 YjbQ family protein [Candidatus Thorarchaeota archaeon]NIW53534.1 YjbQ family protein [Candidatus Korarchaeota archaeon]
MLIHRKRKAIQTSGENDIVNITSYVEEIVKESGIKDGLMNVFCRGSTGGITTIEYEEGLLNDFKIALLRLAPKELNYEHNKKWPGDNNGRSHIRHSIVHSSLSIPISNGTPMLGTWQQVVVVNFDTQPRNREVSFTIIGK